MTSPSRRREAAVTRAHILDAAERLFAERGFDATPTSAIAEAAEVPKGLLFYHFPTKSELLRALVSERMSLGPIDVSLLTAPGDPARSLLNVTEKIRSIEASSHVIGMIASREQHTHPEVLASLLRHRDHVRSLIERVLSASVPTRPAAARLRSAAQAWLAIITTVHSDRAAEAARAELASLAELVCDGLLSRGRPRPAD